MGYQRATRCNRICSAECRASHRNAFPGAQQRRATTGTRTDCRLFNTAAGRAKAETRIIFGNFFSIWRATKRIFYWHFCTCPQPPEAYNFQACTVNLFPSRETWMSLRSHKDAVNRREFLSKTAAGLAVAATLPAAGALGAVSVPPGATDTGRAEFRSATP